MRSSAVLLACVLGACSLHLDAPPVATSLSPVRGPTQGGNLVTITGTSLTHVGEVLFGSTPSPSVRIDSDTSLVAVAPPGSGAVDVVLFSTGGGSTPLSYTYGTFPQLYELTPTHGAAGTTVTLFGAGLTNVKHVLFGAAAAQAFTVVSDKQISAVAPAGSGAVSITVASDFGTSNPIGFGYDLGAPTLTTIAPATGPEAGGTQVTLTGTSFGGTSTVSFGGVAATSVQLLSETQVTAIAPPGTGTVDVTLTTSAGTSNALSFSYAAPMPAIASLSPAHGPQAGGTSVSITGTSLAGATSVTFDGASVAFTSAGGALTATTPAHAGGAVEVVVTTPDGFATASFTYDPAATITSVLPDSGPVAGGTSITLTGTSLTGTSSVTLGGIAATNVVVVNDTTVTALTPAYASGSLVVDVVATTPDGVAILAGGFTYEAPTPTLSNITPNSGSVSGGTNVTLVGSGFYAGTTLTIGGVAATITSVPNGTTLAAIVPAYVSGSLTKDVTVKNTTSATLANGFTYLEVAPTLTSITPSTGSVHGGTSVVLAGTGFSPGTTVTIGGVAATVTAQTATSLTATTPAYVSGPLAKDVTVDNGVAVATLPNGFTYSAVAPSIDSVSPGAGTVAGGTSVTITGSGYVPGTTVTFAGASSSNVLVLDASTITVTTPAYVSGSLVKDVTVTNSAGSATLASAFTYVEVTPTLSSIGPSSSSTLGGTSITLSGTGFSPDTTVTLDGTPATSVVVVSATILTAITPSHAAGSASVVVTNEAGSAVLTNAFTYVTGAPALTAISPTSGTKSGGTTVTLGGSGLSGVVSVTFGGVAATNLVVVNDGTITATTPAYASAAAVDVVVRTAASNATLTAAFTYQ